MFGDDRPTGERMTIDELWELNEFLTQALRVDLEHGDYDPIEHAALSGSRNKLHDTIVSREMAGLR